MQDDRDRFIAISFQNESVNCFQSFCGRFETIYGYLYLKSDVAVGMLIKELGVCCSWP